MITRLVRSSNKETECVFIDSTDSRQIY